VKKFVGLALLACGLLAAAAPPAAPGRQDSFRRQVVQEGGRKKPLDTFARNLLMQFSGRSTLAGMDASAWLARVFFTPDRTLEDRIFLVDQPDVLAAIGVAGEGRGRCSFSELRPGLDRLHELAFRHAGNDGGAPGRFEAGVRRLFMNVSAYYGLLDSFAFARPEGAMTNAIPRSPAIWPPATDPDEPWISPGQALAGPAALPPALRREIELLSDASRAYAADDAEAGDRALAAFDRSLRDRLGPLAVPAAKISLEISYNRLEPFFKAKLAYGLALLLLLLSLALGRRFLEHLSFVSLLAGFLLHGSGMLARMLIMNRPPVTNLYETFVFVAWAGVAMGLLMARLQKQPLGILAGGVAGLLFLVIAGRYALDGDTMGMLAAVLDSNLWLATHVVTIALGYAGCVVAGIIGHVVLVMELLGTRAASALAGAGRALYATLAFGLVFTCIGTLMGGIWADQSWGRFWGWDPKENGALLIIIWCAVLFHARLAGWLGRIGLAAGSIGAIIAVVLAWFGVNVLGVGLHAYGFTAGAARGLLAFVSAETAFLAVTLYLVRKRSRP
jgi:ABC-type transport system involved in cytochrome c biogenesis permease subunit